jgi:hypothetical protein
VAANGDDDNYDSTGSSDHDNDVGVVGVKSNVGGMKMIILVEFV